MLTIISLSKIFVKRPFITTKSSTNLRMKEFLKKQTCHIMNQNSKINRDHRTIEKNNQIPNIGNRKWSLLSFERSATYNISHKLLRPSQVLKKKNCGNTGVVHFAEINQAPSSYSMLQHIGRVATPKLVPRTCLIYLHWK